MSISKLDQQAWHPYFDHMSHFLEGKNAEIEVDALSIGAQVEAHWLPLLGITYDQRSDVLEVALEGLDHLIHKPREIHVDQTAMELLSLEILDADNFRHIVKLRDPLMLPAPPAAGTAPGASSGVPV